METNQHGQRWRGRGGLEAAALQGHRVVRAVENGTEVPRRVKNRATRDAAVPALGTTPKPGRAGLGEGLLLLWSRQHQAQGSRGGSVLDVRGGATAWRERGLACSPTRPSPGRKGPPHTTARVRLEAGALGETASPGNRTLLAPLARGGSSSQDGRGGLQGKHRGCPGWVSVMQDGEVRDTCLPSGCR